MRDNETVSRYPAELLVDSRLGGTPLYYLGAREQRLMRVPDQVRDCAVFLCRRDYLHGSLPAEEGYPPSGTGFFVSVPLFDDSDEIFVIYLVTAKHLLDDICRDGLDGKIYLRLNGRSGPTMSSLRLRRSAGSRIQIEGSTLQ